MEKSNTLFFVDRNSFPVKCPELDDFISIVQEYYEVEYIKTDSPTEYFSGAMSRVEDYELVIPVTRNLFVRDKLRMEGVSLVICL